MGLNKMLERGRIRPVMYEMYKGLERLQKALEGLASSTAEIVSRKVWGKAGIEMNAQRTARITRVHGSGSGIPYELIAAVIAHAKGPG